MDADHRLADYFIFYIALILFFAVGAITTLGLEWYGILLVPSWMPSNFTIAVVWCVLFILTALSVVRVWNHEPRGEGFQVTIALYMSNALLVLFWNYLFFGKHALFLSLALALVVLGTVGALLLRVRRISKKAALFLWPYLAWMILASYLMYLILILNT